MLLDASAITEALAILPGWSGDTSAITTSHQFDTFPEAILGVAAVAQAAEQADHHPDIDIRWRTVTFVLSTHEAGGVTEKDLGMADAINSVLGR